MHLRRSLKLVLVGAAIALLVAGLHAPPVRDLVRARAEAWLAEKAGVAARIGSLDYSLLRQTVEARRVSLAPLQRPSEPFFEADRIAATLDGILPLQLLRVVSVDLERARVSLVSDAQGRLNVPDSQGAGAVAEDEAAGGPPSEAFTVPDTANLRHVSFRYRDEQAGVTVEIPDLTWLARRREGGLSGTLAMDQYATVRWPDLAVTATRLTGRLRWNGRAVALGDVSTTLEPGAPESPAPVSGPPSLGPGGQRSSLATFEGNVAVTDVFGTPALSFEGEGSVALEPATRWLRSDWPASGTVRFTAEVTGAFSSLSTTLRLNGQNVTVNGVSPLAIESRVQLTGGVLALQDTAVRLEDGTLRANGTLSLSRPADQSRLDASWSALPLGRLARLLGARQVPTLEARLDGKASARWRGDSVAAMQVSADNVTRPSPGARVPVAGRLALGVGRGRWTLEHDHALGGLALSGSGGGSITSLDPSGVALGGTVSASITDAVLLAHQLATLDLVDAETVSALTRGSASFEGLLSGTLARPSLAGALSASDVGWSTLPPIEVDARLSVDGSRLAVARGEIVQGTNRLEMEGDLAFPSRAITGTASLEATDLTDAWRAAELPPRWQPRGLLRASVTLGGTMPRPRVSAEIEGTLGVGTLEPSPVGASVRLADNRLTIADLRVQAPAGTLTAGGELDLGAGGQPFRLEGTLSLEHAERLAPAFEPAAWPVEGRLAMRASASGRLAEVADAEVDALLEIVDLAVVGMPVSLEAPARLERRGDAVTVSPLVLRSNQSRVALEGGLGNDRTLAATVDANLEDFAPILARLSGEGEAPPALTGTLRLDATARGPLARPIVEATLTGDGLTAQVPDIPALTDIDIGLALRDGLVSLSRLSGAWQGAVVEATASMPMTVLHPWLPTVLAEALPSPPGPARLSAEVRDVTPTALEPFVSPDTLANLGGRVSARLSLEADRLSAESVQGELVLTDAEVVVASVPLRQRVPTSFAVADGRVRIADLLWEGPGTTITAAGGLALAGDELRLDAGIDATLDLKMVSAFARTAAVAGNANLSVSLSGPASSPTIEGRALVSDAEVRLREPRVAIAGLRGRVLLTGNALRLEQVEGTLNGGRLTAGGQAQLLGWALDTHDVQVALDNAAIEFPEGLRSELETRLQFVRSAGDTAPLLKGTVTLLHARYREQFGPAARWFGARPPEIAPSAARAEGPMSAIRLDLGITTREDLEIDINYGRAEAGATLRLEGTVGTPRLSGRVALRPGGLVYLGGTTYRIERGSVDFRGGATIEPVLDLAASTRVADYTILLEVTGSPDTIRAELSSQPSLDRSDIVSLLVTGRTTDEGGLSSHVVGEQVLGYLSGDLLDFAGRAVGLDSVRIGRGIDLDDLRFDPSIIAGDTDPASRLTITKNLTRTIEVALSQDLSGDGRLTWVATWRPRRTLSFRLVSLDEVDRIYEFRQELSFGGPPRAREDRSDTARARVASVAISGADRWSAELRDALTLTPGKRFDFYNWRDDRDRILAVLHDRDYFEADVSARREDTVDEAGRQAVALAYDVAPGPMGRLVIDGVQLPPAVVTSMKMAWEETVFDGFLVDDLTRLARLALVREGYLQAGVATTVETSPSPDGEVKVVRIAVEPGPQVTSRRIVWNGNTVVDAKRLDVAVTRAGVGDAAWLDPSVLEDPSEQLYRDEGFLEASVAPGAIVFEAAEARLPVRISEGPRAVVRSLAVDGAHAIDPAKVRVATGLEAGTSFRPALLESARQRTTELYFERGFNAVQIDVRATSHTDGAVDVAVGINEGAQQILTDVQVEGAARTHPGLVERALRLTPGEPLDSGQLFEARRRLYGTGAFRRVDLQTEPSGEPPVETETGIAQQPMVARVALEEWPVWRVRYGLQVNDLLNPFTDERDIGPGLTGEIERSNLFGRAATLGAAARYVNNRQALRGYLSAPRFFQWPLSSTLFAQREWRHYADADDIVFGLLDAHVTGLTFEQRFRPGQTTQFNYGYFYQRIRQFELIRIITQPFVIDTVTNSGGLFAAAAFDRRDNPFDARRGWFHSSALKYAAAALGSDWRFVKWSTQQSLYATFGPVVLAWNGRLGLAEGFGQDVDFYERFFAGGTSSVRGYREGSLGPRDEGGEFLGGEAQLVLNHEARFPIWRFLRGVAFVDAGNVFENPTSIDLGALEVGAGFGLRISTPVGLIRLDYGIPLTRDGRFDNGRVHFAFGHLF